MKTIFFFLILTSIDLFSQVDSLSIKGVVISSFNYSPLEDITVILLDGKAKVTHTDTTGSFSFKTANKDNVILRIDSKDTTIILNNHSVQNLQFVLFRTCEYNSDRAATDIKKGHIKLLLCGGDTPAVFAGQEKFEKKYNINYYDFGCVQPRRECIKSYNRAVFDYLDHTYGKTWRMEVRKDVVGLR